MKLIYRSIHNSNGQLHNQGSMSSILSNKLYLNDHSERLVSQSHFRAVGKFTYCQKTFRRWQMIKNLSDHRREYQIFYMNLARLTSSHMFDDIIGIIDNFNNTITR